MRKCKYGIKPLDFLCASVTLEYLFLIRMFLNAVERPVAPVLVLVLVLVLAPRQASCQ